MAPFYGWGSTASRLESLRGGSLLFTLGPTVFLLPINDLLDDAICNIAIYAYDTTIYSKFDQAFHLWQQLELVSEL